MSNPPQEVLTVRIADITELCADVKSFRLVALDGAALPTFTAGAHVDVRIAPGLIRQYSLCNSPSEVDHYLIAVQREEQGTGGSREMHTRYAVGETLLIGRPRNDFPLVDDDADVLLLAGGIGITPLLAMAEVLAAKHKCFELHHFLRSPARAIFTETMARLARSGLVKRHHDTDPDRPDLGALLDGRMRPSRLYLCGPDGFMTAVQAAAASVGWPSARMHLEHFTTHLTANESMPARDDVAPEAGFRVLCRASATTVEVAPGERIIDALRAAGVPIDTSCEVGVCGTCITRVLAGDVVHLDDVLSASERESGEWMTPCCSRAAGAEIVLDV